MQIQKAIKYISKNSYDVEDPIKEALNYVNFVKPYILGQKIAKVFNYAFVRQDVTKRQKSMTYIDIEKKLNTNPKVIMNKIDWEWHIETINGEDITKPSMIIQIGAYQLEFALWAPWEYKLSFNTEDLRMAADASVLSFEECLLSDKYNDVSKLFGKHVIGQKVQDFIIETNEDDFADNEKGSVMSFQLILENGNIIKLYEDVDYPRMEVFLP